MIFNDSLRKCSAALIEAGENDKVDLKCGLRLLIHFTVSITVLEHNSTTMNSMDLDNTHNKSSKK